MNARQDSYDWVTMLLGWLGEWRCVWMAAGPLCVTMGGTIVMRWWCALSWDYRHLVSTSSFSISSPLSSVLLSSSTPFPFLPSFIPISLPLFHSPSFNLFLLYFFLFPSLPPSHSLSLPFSPSLPPIFPPYSFSSTLPSLSPSLSSSIHCSIYSFIHFSVPPFLHPRCYRLWWSSLWFRECTSRSDRCWM